MANKKQRLELLIPGARNWERWVGSDGGPLDRETLFEAEGGFTADSQRRALALPAATVWVLPAWIKGAAEHLRDMAALHLERMGVNAARPETEMHVSRLASDDEAHLVSIVALKDQPSPLTETSALPGEVGVAAMYLPLPEDAVVIWQELGKYVMAITSQSRMVYCAPLSATRLNEHAMGELNNICLQLSFQRVLGRIENLVLWTTDGDVGEIRRHTGMNVSREERPAPVLPTLAASNLMPQDLIFLRESRSRKARNRMVALVAGAVSAAVVAILTGLTALAVTERNSLRERVAELTPKAARVEDHRKSWEEVASAVDPKRFPMEILLRVMEPSSSADVALTHFECTPDTVVVRGRTPSSSVALKYAQEIQGTESLFSFAWDARPPTMASDDSASFELKGVRQ